MPEPIKCIVWDLDDTLWEGIFAEGGGARLHAGVEAAIRAFDERGILQSIASRNDGQAAFEHLTEHGLSDYFLFPQINWGAKSQSIRRIAEELNLGLDSFAFIDDQVFELQEVAHALPEVRCFRADELPALLTLPATNPAVITDDARTRRLRYRENIKRQSHEEAFDGAPEAFLQTLNMHFTIKPANAEDLDRAEELTLRTNQLNSTGVTFSRDELASLIDSNNHLLLTARLRDRFGSYGTIGLCLVETGNEIWHLRLLLMSCRVMSRGVGTLLLLYLLNEARAAGRRFHADFVRTDRNRMMFVTYKFNGFQVIQKTGDHYLFEHPLEAIQAYPSYVTLDSPDATALGTIAS